jgi:hypothetical protein
MKVFNHQFIVFPANKSVEHYQSLSGFRAALFEYSHELTAYELFFFLLH